ncbi:MAG TPA: hypothetical protein DIS88_06485 [Prevotella sp.]|nr:hypothetical protein [Prevotella sp.]
MDRCKGRGKKVRRRKYIKLFHLIQQNKPQIATIRKIGQTTKKSHLYRQKSAFRASKSKIILH